jgi:tetratricopeptide (TPR) repeat protein
VTERRAIGRWSWPAVGAVAFLLAGLTTPVTMQDLPLAAVVLGASVPLGSAVADAAGGGKGRRASGVLVAGVLGALLALAVSVTYLWVGPIASADPGAARAIGAAGLLRADPLLRFVASKRLMSIAESGDPAAAAAAIEQAAAAARTAPRDPFYATEHAAVLASMGRQSEALAEYVRALSLFPDSPDAAQGAALAALALGRTTEAVRFTELMLAVASPRPVAHEVAAQVYDAAGDPARAARERAEAALLRGP